MSDFDLNQVGRLDGSLLLVFRELLRHRRAGKAAARVGLSPSAVSHALARLRELFNDPLFVRRPHGLEPTRRALELGPRVEAWIELSAAMLGSEGRFRPALTERRFVVAAPEFVSALLGAGLIEAVASTAPKASLAFSSVAQDTALEGLRRGEVDLAIGRFGHLRPGLTSEILFEDTYCVVARRGHPRVKGTIDLKAYAEIGLVLATATAETASDEIYPGPHLVNVRAFVPRWLTALHITSTTDAIACCPRRLAERHARMLRLQVLDTPFASQSFAVSAVHRADRNDASVGWLLERVRTACRR